MQVLETAITSQRYSGMGTTIVASLVEGNRLSVGHVGDSRLYVLANDRLRQVTHDDSWMASMLAHNPSVDVARFEQHPMRNALTNVVGSKRRTDVHVVEETLQGGELLLLTTDGVHGVLDDARLEQVILDSSDEDTAASLVTAALARGSRDNCTAVVARYLPE
jgi:protein phosphatase